jgi:hypothetical protein
VLSICPFLCAASLGTASLKLLDYAFEIGIAGAEAPGQPVSSAFDDLLAVSQNFELTSLPGRKDGFNVEALLDEGHEARDVSLVVLSCRAVNDLDLHGLSRCSPSVTKILCFDKRLRRFVVGVPFQNRRCRGDGPFLRRARDEIGSWGSFLR